MNQTDFATRTARFKALHHSGQAFVLANVWDRGSALMMQGLGAQALATSSAAHAFTLGKPDGGTISRDAALAHAQDIISATNLPVSGDFENGYGDAPEDCAETVRLSNEVGLSGICIEDTRLPSTDYYDFDLAVERIRAAAAMAKSLSRDFVLTARADGVLLERYDLDEAIRRLQAFEAAGADCLYAPMSGNAADLKRICDAVGAPVNVLTIGDYATLTREDMQAAGAARISLGSTLSRVCQRALHDTGKAMFEEGRFDDLARVLPSSVTDSFLDS